MNTPKAYTLATLRHTKCKFGAMDVVYKNKVRDRQCMVQKKRTVRICTNDHCKRIISPGQCLACGWYSEKY